MDIIFSVENQTINCVKDYRIVTDSLQYLTARFVFTADWDGCAKTAIFAGKDGTYEVILKDNECTVPHEVLGGRFGISVYGVKGDMRITTDTVYIAVQKSGFAAGETPSDPTPTVYEQLLNTIEEGKQESESAVTEEATARKEADAAIQASVTALSESKADKTVLNDYYTKTDTDGLLENKADKTALTLKADKEYNSGFVGGKNAALGAVGGGAVGLDAKASSGGAVGSGSQASEGGAVGNTAYTSHGGAVGKGAYSMHGGAVGRNAKTYLGAAVGDGAQTVNADGDAITAVQLGTGVNSEENTAQIFSYKLMNADGTIPKERIPGTLNRYDVSALPSKSVTYDFADGVSRFSAVERTTVSVESGVQVITSAANSGNKYGLAQFDFGSVSDGATRLIIEYDTKYDGGRWEISLVDMSKRPGTSDKSTYDETGVAFRTGTRDAANNFYINGDNKYDTTLNDVWVHVRADIDYNKGTLKYEVSSSGTLKYSDEFTVPESVGAVDGLEIYTWAQGTINVDNIVITALYNVDESGMYVTPDGEYIYRDGQPVKLGGDVDLSGYYTKEETDGLLDDKADATDLTAETSARTTAISNINSTITDLNETVLGHGLVISDLDSNAERKTTITNQTGSALTIELENNSEVRCGEVTSLTFSVVASRISENLWVPEVYISSVIFTSGTTATNLTYDDYIAMIGTDCIDGVFVPVAGKRYTIIICNDGAGFVGTVGGYAV